jgi:hypothetical protein
MARSNSGRRRTSVELGADVTAMLAKLRHDGRLRDKLGYFGDLSDSFLIRWAIVCLFRLHFPDDARGRMSAYDVGSQNASGGAFRRRRRRDPER